MGLKFIFIYGCPFFKKWASILLFTLPLLQTGCATYERVSNDAFNRMRYGNPAKAAENLKPFAMKAGDDQLVYLFDYGTALQLAGDYDESTKAFLLADKLSEEKDYHSISRIGGSLLLNEKMIQYKGEEYEKVLINAFLAINFLMKDELDEALVETRRLNEKLHRYKTEAKRNYEQNPFARYLSAIIWEADGKWDDAYIDYEKTYMLSPNIPSLKEMLLHSAKKAQRTEDYERWRGKFPFVEIHPYRKDKNNGELVLVCQQGKGPQKLPNPDVPIFPKLFPRISRGTQAWLYVENIGGVMSENIYSVQNAAIKALDEKWAGLIAKRVAAIAGKAILAEEIKKRNRTLGELAKLSILFTEQADLRQWLSLPETFQVARMPLKPGKYKIRILARDSDGRDTGESSDQEIEIRPGKKTFINWRSFK